MIQEALEHNGGEKTTSKYNAPYRDTSFSKTYRCSAK